ncbi:MAG: hypothetical protein D8M57_13190 [Candidatus Scalindua sp. AMX11]|nr:MAG: hypothetical protein DWQ00_11900 [Candidatus Scalindua sp.]NOG83770.1 hypothetical protein [Planctomycetota bacterium]RZV82929.1 MAG: hypothetical protein EX341_09055 [Candidatus Scalindua sp. SCAELEC01]TDE64449.1 MAG: hypothetical protein D8M57_13190 [Candidatus Scalindua sp. AMX11]GJQ59778.1 MAG: hypothetical protein SCALA701_25790 [Candidatus Scalindua sp.]
MAGITLVQAQAQLTTWLDASTKIASGQSYNIGNRTLTRADVKYLQEQIEYWNKMVNTLSSGGVVARGITPI